MNRSLKYFFDKFYLFSTDLDRKRIEEWFYGEA